MYVCLYVCVCVGVYGCVCVSLTSKAQVMNASVKLHNPISAQAGHLSQNKGIC